GIDVSPVSRRSLSGGRPVDPGAGAADPDGPLGAALGLSSRSPWIGPPICATQPRSPSQARGHRDASSTVTFAPLDSGGTATPSSLAPLGSSTTSGPADAPATGVTPRKTSSGRLTASASRTTRTAGTATPLPSTSSTAMQPACGQRGSALAHRPSRAVVS